MGDYQILNNVVQGLHQFQRLIGPINLIFAKGRASEFICDNVQKLSALSGLVGQESDSEHVIDLIVFDREEDYASLFLSQLNYSGILDETFSIKCGKRRCIIRGAGECLRLVKINDKYTSQTI